MFGESFMVVTDEISAFGRFSPAHFAKCRILRAIESKERLTWEIKP